MKNKTIYLLRHGETDYNKRGMVQGRGVDASLNENGRNQAKQIYEALKHTSIDQVYTSVLVRTQETVLHFAQPKKSMAGFDEISWGSQEGVVPSRESRDLFWKAVQSWRDGQLDECVGGGESPNQVMVRQKLAIEEVLQDDAQTTLICMHGRAIRIMMCWLLNYSLRYMDGFEHQNCCYYKLLLSEGVYTVEGFNEIGHLK